MAETTETLHLTVGEKASLGGIPISQALAVTMLAAMARSPNATLKQIACAMSRSVQGDLYAAYAIAEAMSPDPALDGLQHEGLLHVVERAKELATELDELLALDCIHLSTRTDGEDSDD